jgi:hypothetical protein
MKTSILYDPVFSELFDAAQESPELDRVLGNMRRHIEKGTYDLGRTIHSVDRYVVETAAIDLHRKKVSEGGDPATVISPRSPKVSWFTRYPADVRRVVAEKVVKGWEREVRVEMEEMK